MKILHSLTLFLFITFALSAQNGKLFLLAGQSNAVGNGNATLSPICTPGTAYEYNEVTDAVQTLTDPMGQNMNNLQQGKGSIGPAFANKLHALINKPIYMISAGRGGASNGTNAELLHYGTWDETGNLLIFSNAVNKVNKAIKKTGLTLSGIIWMQGERDANGILAGKETEADYQKAFENLIARFRAQFGAQLPFYIVLTGIQTGVATTGNLAVRHAQCAVAKKISNVFVAYTSTNTYSDKGWLMDNVHYTQPAYNEIGDSVARFVSNIRYDSIAITDTILHRTKGQ